MPIYEYQCQSCGHQFEEIQRITDPPTTCCPECKEKTVSKLISASQFKLKGSGWYETDFKNKPKPETETKQSSETSKQKPTESDSKKTDTKKTKKETKND